MANHPIGGIQRAAICAIPMSEGKRCGRVENSLIEQEKAVLASLENSGETEPLALAEHLTKLADMYFQHEDFEQAEPLYWRALEMVHHAYGPVHLKVADSLQNLAELYEIQAKYSKAEQLYECIIAILSDLPDESCPAAIEVLRRIDGFYESRGLDWQRENVKSLCGKFRGEESEETA